MIKKILSLLIATLILVSVVGCGNSEVKKGIITAPESFYAYTFDRFGDEVMPIGGYIGPTSGFGYKGNYMPSQITDYHYQLVKECGLNFIIGMRPDYKVQTQDVIDALTYADKNDVMYFVYDTYLYEVNDDNAANPDRYVYVSIDAFKERVKAYSRYNSFAGLVCRDEPWANMFEQIKKINYYFDETFENNKLLYLNSNSMQCPDGWFGSGEAKTYKPDMTLEEYMTEWFESFPTLGYYSYDTYPFTTHNSDYIRTDIFKNYSLVRRYCEKYKVPFWTFMQAGGDWGGTDSNWRVTDEGEIWWQVSTALAFGAKGYTWFPYNTPPENIGSPEGSDGLIGRGGQKTEQWYYVKNVNEQTRACDHILMKSVYKGMIRNLSGKEDSTNALVLPDIENAELNGKFREVVSISGDNSVTGCFTYFGKTVLYVVNNSISLDKANIKVSFDGKYEFEVIQRAKSQTMTGNGVELTFAPGEGALIAIH